MPLHEAVAAPPQDVTAEAAALPPVGPGPTAQGYEYTRQDGTVEYAANREEAINLCPVLGKLAMNDPEAANLLLDIASAGRAEMAEEAERSKPETPEPAEPAHKAQTPPKTSNAARAEAATAADVAPLEKQAHEAAVLEAAASADQKPINVLTEPGAPVVPQPEKVAAGQAEPKQSSMLRHSIAAEGRLIHERREHEAEQHITPAEIVRPVRSSEPQPDIAGTASQTLEHEVLHAERTLKPAEQAPLVDQEQTGQTMPAVMNVISPDQLTIFDTEQLIVSQEINEWVDKPTELAETLPGGESTEPVSWTAEAADDVLPSAAEAPPALDIEQAEPVVSWAAELDKEPLRIYEDFSEALHSLVALSGDGDQLAAGPEIQPAAADEGEPTSTGETQRAEAVPAIAVAVSERLTELTAPERETVAPVLADIVETVQVREALETEAAEPEAIETAQAKLEELVVVLFERLEVAYEPEDIERFAAVLLRPALQPPPPEVAEFIPADLEHDGTHEANIRFAGTTAGLIADVEHSLERLLGTLVLFSTAVFQL